MLELGIRSAAALGIAGGFALAGYALAARLAGARPTPTRWLATLVAAAWLGTFAFHTLAAVRWFALVPALVASALAGTAGWLAAGRTRELTRALGDDARYVRRVGRRVRRSRHRWWIAAFFALASPGLLRAVLLPPIGFDTLTYHGVKAAMWVQNAGVDSMVGTGSWAYYRNMPAGAEVFTAWAMLPMHADTLTGLLEIGQWLGLGLAVLVLCRELGAREPFGSAAAGLVLAVPTVFVLPGSGYVELMLLLTLLGSLALALRGLRGRPGLLALAGAGLGISAATKFPVVPLSASVLAIVVTLAMVRGTSRHRAFAVAGVAGYLAALVPWLVLSWQRTGAPFSPFPISLGGWVLGHATPELEWLLSRPLPPMPGVVREMEVLVRIFHPPVMRSEALGALSLVPIALAPAGLVRLGRRDRVAAALLACAAAFSGALFFAPDLAGVRAYWPISSSRFLLPFWTLAVAASVAWPRSAWRSRYLTVLRVLASAQLAAYVGYGFSSRQWGGVAAVAVGIVALGLVAWMALRLRAPLARAAVVALAVIAGAVLLAALRDGLRQDFLERGFAVHKTPREWAPAVPFVDDPEDPRTIAITSGPRRTLDNWHAYPFFGRRLQNTVVYVPLAVDGRIRPFGDGAALAELERTADFDAWLGRLRALGVREVMSFAPPSLELSWMAAHPESFEPLSGDGNNWGLYRLR